MTSSPYEVFPQSSQDVQDDSFLAGSIALVLLSLLFVSFAIWLFAGRLTFYAESPSVSLSSSDTILAAFPNAQPLTIGQIAEVRYSKDEVQMEVEAIVGDITAAGRAELFIVEEAAYSAIFIEKVPIDVVRIAQHSVSPIRFVFVNAGLSQ